MSSSTSSPSLDEALTDLKDLKAKIGLLTSLREMMHQNAKLFDGNDQRTVQNATEELKSKFKEVVMRVAAKRQQCLENFDEKTGVFEQFPDLCEFFLKKQLKLSEIATYFETPPQE